ncbi:hypothetical protein K4K60_009023 [Colletotrichum sp. SAR11_57]|nr:hypothetical protein K4K60_009023 [Colletotrichum sp. SAR11_57]
MMFLWMKTSTTQKQVSLGSNYSDISEKVQGNGWISSTRVPTSLARYQYEQLHGPYSNWQYHAVRYYHQAIRCLKYAIALGGYDDTRDMDGGRHTDTFAAVAILCMQDFLCAFISETQTRLNLDHVRLWQNFGLATDENSLLLPFSPFCTADIRASTDVDEDSKSNELLWLLGKVVNFITSGDGIKPEDYSRPAGQRMSLGVTQELLLQRWEKLEMELQRWYESLPPTFAPSARTKYTTSTEGGENVKDMEMIWWRLSIINEKIMFLG